MSGPTILLAQTSVYLSGKCQAEYISGRWGIGATVFLCLRVTAVLLLRVSTLAAAWDVLKLRDLLTNQSRERATNISRRTSKQEQ